MPLPKLLKSSFILINFYILIGFASLLNAQSPSDPIVESIVLSKNCPIPDGPDLVIKSPEIVLKSVDDPYCPKINDIQLVQVTVHNPGEEVRSVGLEVLLTLDGNRLDQSQRQIFTIPPYETSRMLHDVVLEAPGRYRVAARIWDTEFEKPIAESDQGVNRQFYIATPDDLAAAQEQLIVMESSGKAPRPSPLQFDPPDLRWESVSVLPEHLLRGETLRMRLNLVNVGGDVVQDVLCKVEYYNERQPRRRTTIANPIADVIAPGETVTFDLEYIPPTDQLLGEYKIAVTVDPDDQLKELKEDNNAMESGTIRLSDIRLLLPSDSFVFDENGLFLFQWDSLVFAEFKIQVGVDEKFEDPRLYFDLPQGDRWIADKELVPLTGELPGMAMGLMQTSQKNKLFWRVIGRNISGQQAISDVQSFTIKPTSDAS